MVDIEGKEKEMTLHDIIEKISMNDYTQYEIRVMLEEYLPIQRKIIEEAFQDGAEHFGGTMTLPLSHVYYERKFSKDNSEPFVTEGLLAIPEEHIFDGLKEVTFATRECYVCQLSYDPYLDADMQRRTLTLGYSGHFFHVEITSKCDNDDTFNRLVKEMLTGGLGRNIEFAYTPSDNK